MAIDLNTKPWYVALIVGLVIGVALFVVMQMYGLKDVQEGIENTPKTFLRLFEGKNRGKQLLKLADPPVA